MEQPRRELRTWPEIAAYLGFTARAVQNHEKTSGLPVHRLPGQRRGQVWAYSDELDAWKLKRTTENESAQASSAADSPLESLHASAVAGHWLYAAAASGLYALLYAESVILEVAYRLGQDGGRALLVAPIVFCWIWVSGVLALAADRWKTVEGQSRGLAIALSIIYGSTAVLQIAISRILPRLPVTDQAFRQPWSAQIAYAKNVFLYFLPMATFYILLPFHFVLALQRDLRTGRHESVLSLLSGEKSSAAPKGAVYLRVVWLAWGLFAASLLAVVMTEDLFDHLKPSPYKILFMYLALGRTLLLFATALFCLLWYSRTLNEVKRECLTM